MKVKILDKEYDGAKGRAEVVSAFEAGQGRVQVMLSAPDYFILCSRGLNGRFHLTKTYHHGDSYFRENLTPLESKMILLRHIDNDPSFEDRVDLSFDPLATARNAKLREDAEFSLPDVNPASMIENMPVKETNPAEEKVLGYDKNIWVFAAVLLIVGVGVVVSVMGRTGNNAALQADVARDINEFEKEKARRERIEEGLKARDSFDEAMRAEAAERRARLEKASKTVRTTNTNGVRVDQYMLKKGGIISCTTTISGNSPAIFNCDGDV